MYYNYLADPPPFRECDEENLDQDSNNDTGGEENNKDDCVRMNPAPGNLRNNTHFCRGPNILGATLISNSARLQIPHKVPVPFEDPPYTIVYFFNPKKFLLLKKEKKSRISE